MENEIIDMDVFEENMPNVIIGILKTAMADYKQALKKKQQRKIRKLEAFFYSDYCEQMLAYIGFDEDLFYEKLSRLQKQYV